MNAKNIDTIMDHAAIKRCPLCGEANNCGNTNRKGAIPACWCMSPQISFPESLLTQVPEAKKGKACICKRCAQKHQKTLKGL